MNNNNGVITSSPSKYGVKWSFDNQLDCDVTVSWINFQGDHDTKPFTVPAKSKINPGTTYVGHVFLVTESASGKFVKLINIMGSDVTLN